jgi:hypothetical protein
MSATLLQLIQQATGEMGLAVPTVVTGSTNADTIQQLALLNAVGYELLRQHPWQALLKAKINTPALLDPHRGYHHRIGHGEQHHHGRHRHDLRHFRRLA